MIDITIHENLTRINPNVVLGTIRAAVVVEKHNAALWLEIEKTAGQAAKLYTLESLLQAAEIRAVRETYKALGKDPSRYRGSAEALLRRIIQGKGVYKVNNIVDINNLVSIKTVLPVGSYDLGKITEPIIFRVGVAGESYKGIGKETINISELPVFVDAEGPYGSPTSDSERAMITETTKEVLLVIISFSGKSNLELYLDEAAGLLEKFAGASRIDKLIIS